MTIGSFRPTPEQQLLLLAALLGGPEAAEAFESWATRVNFDLLDQGSYRILPALHANLRTRGVTHPLMSRLQSVSRAAWYRNQLLRHRGADVVRSLESAGLETLLLKGAALVASGYVDVGARPMSDVDILVRRRDANAAMDTLLAAGWEPWP
ncbi:MAG: nucleotidyltransferase family protein, partial [Acidobacteriota bacterium]